MSLDRIRITSVVLVCWLGAALASGMGCGASKSEVREAMRSGYDADFAIVYREVLAAVREAYPHITENPVTGVVRTAWHPIRVSSGQDGPTSTQQADRAMNPFSAANMARKQYFIRFDILVVGGDPWRVRVVGQASEWDAGGVPAELRGANEPHWLKGRTEALRVAIHRRLQTYAVRLPSTEIQVEEPPREPVPGVDASMLGDIPPAAAQAAAAVVAAVRAHDMAALRGLVHPEVMWSPGAPPGVDTALAMWQADASLLGQLAGIIEQGCRKAQAGTAEGKAEVTCPPAHGTEPGYSGYRAGFAPGADGAWKLVFFVGP